MNPIQYGEQIYLASHCLHKDYRNNSNPGGGKYAELKSFNRLIRSIEIYNKLIEEKDIVELEWSVAKDITGTDFAPVFLATNYNPIMLVNITAQAELIHHLDDEISKQMAMNANKRATKQLPVAESYPEIAKNHRARIQLAKMCGLSGSKALIAANDWTAKEDGVNIMQSLGIKSLKSDIQSAEMTGTEIGQKANIPGNGQGKAQNVNLALWHLGYLDSFVGKKGLIWRISEKGLKSKHLEYDDVDKANGKRGAVQAIIYHETLIPLLKEVNLTIEDYKKLKQDRREKSLTEGAA